MGDINFLKGRVNLAGLFGRGGSTQGASPVANASLPNVSPQAANSVDSGSERGTPLTGNHPYVHGDQSTFNLARSSDSDSNSTTSGGGFSVASERSGVASERSIRPEIPGYEHSYMESVDGFSRSSESSLGGKVFGGFKISKLVPGHNVFHRVVGESSRGSDAPRTGLSKYLSKLLGDKVLHRPFGPSRDTASETRTLSVAYTERSVTDTVWQDSESSASVENHSRRNSTSSGDSTNSGEHLETDRPISGGSTPVTGISRQNSVGSEGHSGTNDTPNRVSPDPIQSFNGILSSHGDLSSFGTRVRISRIRGGETNDGGNIGGVSNNRDPFDREGRAPVSDDLIHPIPRAFLTTGRTTSASAPTPLSSLWLQIRNQTPNNVWRSDHLKLSTTGWSQFCIRSVEAQNRTKFQALISKVDSRRLLMAAIAADSEYHSQFQQTRDQESALKSAVSKWGKVMENNQATQGGGSSTSDLMR